MKKILISIVLCMLIISLIFYLIATPESTNAVNYATKGEGKFFIPTMIFLVYVVIGIPVTLVIDLIVSLIPKQKLLFTYLIQILLYFIVTGLIGFIVGGQFSFGFTMFLSIFVFLYFHILFLLRLPYWKAKQLSN
jgi:hypothetical protein